MAIEKRRRKDGTIAYRVRLEGAASGGDRDQGGSRTFDTRKEADAYDHELKRGRRMGLTAAPSRQRYGDYLAEWLDDKALTARRTTMADYAFLCTRHVAPVLGHTPLAALTPRQLQQFLNQKARSGRLDGQGGLSRARVGTLRSILHDSLAAAVRGRLLAVNPADGLTLPRAKPKSHKGWTADQVAQFIEATTGDPYAALWLLALTTGLRRGELLGLRWCDVDLEHGTITVRETWVQVGSKGDTGEPKSDTSARCISIGPRTTEALRAHHGRQYEYKSGTKLVWEEHGLVFPNEYGRPLHPTSPTHMFRRLSDRLGLPHIRLHDTRRTAATLSLAGGTPLRTVSDRLGHADPRTTMGIYVYGLQSEDRRAAEALERTIWGEPSHNPPMEDEKRPNS